MDSGRTQEAAHSERFPVDDRPDPHRERFRSWPKRGEGTWHEFVRRHLKTLWVTHFSTKTVWTLREPVVYYVLFLIHIQTRRVHIAGMTPNPDGVWMAQQARNMSMIFGEEPDEYKPTHIVRDRDSKFTKYFRSILEDDSIEFRPIPPLGNVPIGASLPPPEPLERFALDDVVCHESLGGLLKHYERKAA